MRILKRDQQIPIAEAGRRNFLKYGAALPLGLLQLKSAGANAILSSAATSPTALTGERMLQFYNTHTGESLKAVYWVNGTYIPEAITQINRILRDHRSNQSTSMDSGLFDLLQRLGVLLEAKQPFHIISGYRSPETNASLSKNGHGVAKKSLHMLGKAIDIRLPGKDLSYLRKAAMALNAGGVGYYPDSQFVHVDTGRVRSW